MARKAPVIEVKGRREDLPPRKRTWWPWVVGAVCLLLAAGGYGWLRARQPPETPLATAQADPVAATGKVAVAAAALTNVPTVATGGLTATGMPVTVAQPEAARPGAIRVKATVPDYAAEFLAGTSKRLRLETNAWQDIQTFPHMLQSIPPGPRQVRLEAVGFHCSCLSGADEATVLVDSGRTNEVEFVLSPRPATLTVVDDFKGKMISPEQVHARHILVSVDRADTDSMKEGKKALAERIRGELLTGADFGALARAHSDCPSKERDGDLGVFGRGRMVKPFEDAAFGLRVGQISEAMETQFGYHIIQVLRREGGGRVDGKEAPILTVECNPPWLEGHAENPQFVPSLKPLTLTISAPGYRVQTVKLDPLVPGAAERREVTLEPEIGALRIEAAVPTNAAAYFEGMDKRVRISSNAWQTVKALPYMVEGLACEVTPVELVVTGFQMVGTAPRAVQVLDGQTTTVTFALSPLPATLTVLSNQEVETDAASKAVPVAAGQTAGETMSVDLGGGEMMEFVWCPATTSEEWKTLSGGNSFFVMGSPESERGRVYSRDRDTETQHPVMLTEGFWIGKYEVTQAQWERVTGSNPSEYKDPRNPVENVSWFDCQLFIGKLRGIAPNVAFRLPTEEEWEYACRAGTTNALNNGKELTQGTGPRADVDAIAWHYQNSGGTPHRVGQKMPNAWGAYDMSGNVWEWCQEWYAKYPADKTSGFPDTPKLAPGRVCRGGGYNLAGQYHRSACRDANGPGAKSSSLGFRLVADGSPSPQTAATTNVNMAGLKMEGRPWVLPAIGMEFVWIPSLKSWVGKYEVTNGEYRKHKASHDSGKYEGLSLNGDRQPVVNVNFADAKEYVTWLNMSFKDQLPKGYGMRLPTDDEWTMLIKCGDDREYPWGNDWPPQSGKAGNYQDQTANKAFGWSEEKDHGYVHYDYNDGHEVSCDVEDSWANPWGIYGLGGNVWELTSQDRKSDAFGRCRGGGWNRGGQFFHRCMTVMHAKETDRDDAYGFRLMMSPKQDAASRSVLDAEAKAIACQGAEKVLAGEREMAALPKAHDGKYRSTVFSLAFSPDGAILASGSADDSVKLWSMPDGKLQTKLVGHDKSVNSVAISPAGDLLVSGGGGDIIKLWSLPDGSPRGTFRGLDWSTWAVAISPDGKTLVTGHGDSDNGVIGVWALPDCRLRRTLWGHRGYVGAMAISPNGRFMASGSDNTVHLWSLADGALLGTMTPCDTYDKAWDGRVSDLVFGSNGSSLIPASAKTMRWWSIPEGALMGERALGKENARQKISGLAVSKQGDILASIDAEGITLWSMPDFQVKAKMLCKEGDCVALSPDGQWLVSGHGGGQILLWELNGDRRCWALYDPSPPQQQQ